MKHFLFFALVISLACTIGCSKTGSKPAGGNNDSTNTGTGGTGGTTGGKSGLAFAGNEYTGVMTELSRYWAKPFVIDFNADSAVNVFCDFYLVVDNDAFNDDSLPGKIFKISSGVGGGLLVDVSYPDIKDTQEYTFTADLSGLTGGSVGAQSGGLASNQFTFAGATLFTKPGVSLVNSTGSHSPADDRLVRPARDNTQYASTEELFQGPYICFLVDQCRLRIFHPWAVRTAVAER